MELNARTSARVSKTAEGVRGDDGDMELNAAPAENATSSSDRVRGYDLDMELDARIGGQRRGER